MPQATDEIRAPWHNEEADYDIGAWNYLKSMGWTEEKFFLVAPRLHDQITDKEWGAVDYLVDEWDWAYRCCKN